MPSESGEGASLTAKGKEDLVSEIGSPGPFSVSTRVGIMTALLGSKRATFTELLLVVKTPKSSLNKNLGILEDSGFVKQSRGFLLAPGPRTIVEITTKGEEAIKKHLELMRALANKFLESKVNVTQAREEEFRKPPGSTA